MDQLSVHNLLSIRQTHFWSPKVSPFSFADRVYTHLYKNAIWSSTRQILSHTPESVHGSIFNIEFSPVDDTALTVSSNRTISSYDPRISPSASPVQVLHNAHDDCVNCLTFLDGFLLATCSDDKTIRVWDLRNFKHSLAVLQGHENWVKNVEYDRRSGKIFSIAFLDGVRVWDINKLCEYTSEKCDNIVLEMADPVRMKLSPDGCKMFVSGRDNISLIINDFDGHTISSVNEAVQLLFNAASTCNCVESSLVDQLNSLKSNRPSLHVMSGLNGRNSYRSIMSAVFFPSGDFIGLRHVDMKNNRFHAETLSLYDLRELSDDAYRPLYSAWQCQDKYLMYIDEDSPIESLDFIKEISLSRDGRILASPYRRGVRLLAVDPKSTQLDTFFDDRYHSPLKAMKSQDLEVLQTVDGHKQAVLACKFANNDLLIGTGCVDGHVLFHKPRLG